MKLIKTIYSSSVALLFFISASVAQNYEITTGLPLNIRYGNDSYLYGLTDENFIGPVSIGFDFPFFGDLYNQFYISSNGFITFGDSNVSPRIYALPNTGFGFAKNLIAYAASDLKFNKGYPTVRYFVSGESPNRVFVLTFNNVEHYSFYTPKTTVQLQLYESTGIIEIHSTANQSNSYRRTIGICNEDGSIAYTPVSMNDSYSINLVNEMIRFTACTTPPKPEISINNLNGFICQGDSVIINGVCQTGNLSWSTGDTVNALKIAPFSSLAISAFCSDNGCVSQSDTIIRVLEAPIISAQDSVTLCYNSSVNIEVANPVISNTLISWYRGQHDLLVSDTLLIVDSSGLYYASYSNGSCLLYSDSTIVIADSTIIPTPILTSDFDTVCGRGYPAKLTAAGCPGTLNWYSLNPTANLNFASDSSRSYFINQKSQFFVTCSVGDCVSESSDTLEIDYAAVSIKGNYFEICPEGSTVLYPVFRGNKVPVHYQWKKGVTNIADSTNQTINVNTAGEYNIEVEFSDGCVLPSYSFLGGFGFQLSITDSLKSPNITAVYSDSTKRYFKQFDKRYGTNSSESAIDFIQLENGEMILVGNAVGSPANGDRSENSFSQDSDIWVLRLDKQGEKVWDKIYGGTGFEVVRKVFPDKDNGFLLLGSSNSGINGTKTSPNKNTFGNPDYDFWVVKIDSLGNQVWDKSFGGVGLDRLEDVDVLPNGNYLISGYSNASPSGNVELVGYGNVDYWALEVDSSFFKIREFRYGGSGADRLTDFEIFKNGDYGFIGLSSSPDSGVKTDANLGGDDVWIIRTDSLGNIKWDTTIGTSQSELSVRVSERENNLFLTYQEQQPTFHFEELNSSGLSSWSQSYSGLYFEPIVRNTEEGYFLVGSYYNQESTLPFSKASVGLWDIGLLKMDTLGMILYEDSFGESNYDNVTNFKFVNDGILIVGSSYSDAGLFKTQDSRGVNDYYLVSMVLGKEGPENNVVDSLQGITLIAGNCPGSLLWSDGQNFWEASSISVNPEYTTTYTATCLAYECSESSEITLKVYSCDPSISLTNLEDIFGGTSENPISKNAYIDISASNKIGSSANTSYVKFTSGSRVLLNPGFEVTSGSTFKAQVTLNPCND